MGPKEQKLLRAAGKGDLEETVRLIQDGANLNAINEEGESALTRAISRKQTSVARILLENGATTDYTGFLVHKPLHVAVQTANIQLVELLLDNGADIDELTTLGSVLSQAIWAGREDITSLLLHRGADVNLARRSFRSPLGNAVRRKNERLIRDLLKRGAETDILRDKLHQGAIKLLPESSRCLLRDWQAQGYEEQAKIIHNPSSGLPEKEDALVAALTSASKHRQPQIHSMFIELAEELNIATTKEHVYRS